jgi:hypothetical protein
MAQYKTVHDRLSEYADEMRKLKTCQLEYELRAQAEHHGLLRNQIADTSSEDPFLTKIKEDLNYTVHYITIIAQEIQRRYIP